MGPFTGCLTRHGFLRQTNERTVPSHLAGRGDESQDVLVNYRRLRPRKADTDVALSDRDRE